MASPACWVIDGKPATAEEMLAHLAAPDPNLEAVKRAQENDLGLGLFLDRAFSPQARAARAAQQHSNAKGEAKTTAAGKTSKGSFGDKNNFTGKQGDKFVAFVGGKKVGEFATKAEAEAAYNKAGGPGPAAVGKTAAAKPAAAKASSGTVKPGGTKAQATAARAAATPPASMKLSPADSSLYKGAKVGETVTWEGNNPFDGKVTASSAKGITVQTDKGATVHLHFS